MVAREAVVLVANIPAPQFALIVAKELATELAKTVALVVVKEPAREIAKDRAVDAMEFAVALVATIAALAALALVEVHAITAAIADLVVARLALLAQATLTPI